MRDTSSQPDFKLAIALATLWIIVAGFGVLTIQPWRPQVPLSNDFVSFWTGAVFVRDGAGPSLFDMESQARFQEGLRLSLTGRAEMRTGVVLDPFHSPPAQALPLVPLTYLPLAAAYLVFSVLSLTGMAVVVWVLMKGHPWRATATVLLVSFSAVADTLVFGQVNAQFVLALGLGLMALSSGRPLLGGALLGILWLKPQYAVLFPVVFVFKRRWAELAGMVGMGLAIGAVSLLLVGPEGMLRFVLVLREIGGFYPPADSFIFPEAMVNWRGVVINAVPGIPAETGSLAMAALGAATALVALGAWRGPWEPCSPRFARQVLALTIAAVLASPHSNFHGMVLLLAPLALCIVRSPAGIPHARTWNLLLAIIYLLSLAVWPFKGNSWLLVPLLLAVLGILVMQARGLALPGRPAPTEP